MTLGKDKPYIILEVTTVSAYKILPLENQKSINKIKPLIQIRSAVKCCIATERDELVCGKLIHSAKEVYKVGDRILGNKLDLTSDLCSADSAHVYNEAWKRDGLEDDGLEAAEIFNLTHRTALVFANADQRGSIGTPPTVELACN